MDISTMMLLSLVSGATTAYVAKKRGKNPYLWLVIGLLLGAFGVFAFFFLPDSKRKTSRKRRTLQDRYLIGPIDRFWYYVDSEKNPVGPMSHTALSRALREGKIHQKTLIWHDQMKDWKEAEHFLA